jgi:hypothetical protein
VVQRLINGLLQQQRLPGRPGHIERFLAERGNQRSPDRA